MKEKFNNCSYLKARFELVNNHDDRVGGVESGKPRELKQWFLTVKKPKVAATIIANKVRGIAKGAD